ncbi:MAG: PcfJ domain-containing protein [Phycisphaeraceae bacterium]|nr:PcfJ domain-containing protein [Phycisphaeraceae bacterium]
MYKISIAGRVWGVSPWPDLQLATRRRVSGRLQWRPHSPSVRYLLDPRPDRVLIAALEADVHPPQQQPMPAHPEPDALAVGEVEPPWLTRVRWWVRSERDIDAACQWARSIPIEVRRHVLTFPCRQWRLLEAFRELGTPAHEYMASGDHVLLYLLACARDMGPRWPHRWEHRDPRLLTWEGCRELVRQRRRDVLGALGLPPTNAAAKLLRKMTPQCCQSMGPGRCPPLFDSKAGQVAAHMPRIPWGVAELLSGSPAREPFWMVSPDFLRAVAALTDEHLGGRVGRWVNAAARYALRCGRFRAFGPLTRVEQAPIRFLKLDRNDPGPFPPPPLPGMPDLIEPLLTGEQLANEGEVMQHCVQSYNTSIHLGRRYIYRILPGAVAGVDRATLALRCIDGVWRLDQLRGRRNAKVRDKTKRIVSDWLNSFGQGDPAESERGWDVQGDRAGPRNRLNDARPQPIPA